MGTIVLNPDGDPEQWWGLIAAGVPAPSALFTSEDIVQAVLAFMREPTAVIDPGRTLPAVLQPAARRIHAPRIVVAPSIVYVDWVVPLDFAFTTIPTLTRAQAVDVLARRYATRGIWPLETTAG